MVKGGVKRGISKAAIRKWAEESYQSEQRRYDLAQEEVQKLRDRYAAEQARRREEIEQAEAERRAILAEREAEEQAELEARKRAETVKDTASAPQAVGETVTKSQSAASLKPKEQIVKEKEKESFWTSLWTGIVYGLLKNPVSPSFGTPLVYEHTKSDIDRRDNAQKVFWTKDAVSAYNIQKNKVEIQKYTGDIAANKEKLEYAGIINTYADNVQEYLKLKAEYNTLLSDNTLEGRMRRAEVSNRMRTLQKWNNDLDESMKIATSYEMSYGNPMSSITSYESSIGAPRNYSGNSLQEDGRSIYNQYKRLLSKPELTDNDLMAVQQAVNKVKSGVKKYGDKINKENAIASQKMDEEYNDLREWEEWHTPSAEFRAKEKAAQSNYLFDWDTYAYAFPGTLGSSMSFGGVQMLSTALNMLGGVAIQSGNPYAVGGGVAATLAGAGLGIVSGVNENKSEVGSNYTDAVREDLEKNKLLEDFIAKGEKQLKKKGLFYHENEDDKIEDILNYFVRGDVEYNDQRINNIARKHLFGANNLFQNDMVAVSADVAFDTGLNLFMPAGSVAKALKITPTKAEAYRRLFMGNNPLIGNVIKRLGNVESGVGTKVLDAVSPVAGWGYRTAKAAIPQLNKIHAGAEAFANGMKKGVKNLVSFITDAPASAFKINTVGKGMLTFGGMSVMRGFSEAIEEGKQYRYGERFKEGGFAGKSNSILETLADDFSTGTSAALAFFGSQFLGIESDSELMSNMRGGFVGGILNHGTAITAYQQANNTIGEMKMGDLFMNNLMYQRIQERSEMINGTQFAKYATNPNKIAQMNAAIDRMIDISERYREKAESDPTQSYWTKEDIETQRELFNRIVNVANSSFVQQSLKRQNIDIDSERGNAAVALIAYGLNKRRGDVEISNDHIRQFNDLIEQDRLVSDQVGNLRPLLENIEDLESNPILTKEEVDYLRKIYDETVALDDANKPHTKKKLNSRQKRRAETEFQKTRLDRITDKIKRRIENDKNIDAAFAKHYALLKLKNELESIPEDMRSRTQRNQLKSVEHQLSTFLDSLSPMQKIMHQVQTEETLADLGKNRGFFQQMSAAFRTIALDNASLMQDEAFLHGMLGKDANMFLDTYSATNVLLTESKKDQELARELFDNITDAIKDKDTFEAKRDALIQSYLKSVQDDYKLFEQIRDNFQDAGEILQTEGENQQQAQAEHTRTISENVQPEVPAASFDDVAKREARKAKRRRWKENRRRREEAWNNMNDAWEEPDNDRLIRDTYDPADMDELEDPDDQYTLGDYMAQYNDAWEEPWWDELTSERSAAEAEDAAFMEQYSSSNEVIEGRRLAVEQLMNKYKPGTVINGLDGNKRVSYAVVDMRYNRATDTVSFALQRLKINATPDKRFKTTWVTEVSINQYTPTARIIDIDFEEQPRSLNGITVGKKYNLMADVEGVITPYMDVEVIEIDDDLNVHFKTSNGIPSDLPIDQFNEAVRRFKDDVGDINVELDNSALVRIAEDVNLIVEILKDSPALNVDAIIKAVTSLHKLYLANKDRVIASNIVDSFIEENGVLVRKTKASHRVHDMAYDNKVEERRRAQIIGLFSTNGINNIEHTLRVLEGWYNNTLAEDEKDVIKVLGNPVDVTGAPLHTNKIDLSPYIRLAAECHFGTTEMDHVAYIISREYDRPAVTDQDRVNDIMEKIVRAEDVEESALSEKVLDIFNDIYSKGYVIFSLPIHAVGNEYTYENNLFMIDALGNIRSLFLPVRVYDYNERLNQRRTFPETDRQNAQSPINYDRKSRMTEYEWQDMFAEFTSSLMMEYGIANYKGTYQVPIQSKNGVITVSDKHIKFDPEGMRIQPLTSEAISSEMQTITTLVQKATNLLNNNRDILPFTSCIEMLDFCDKSIRSFEPGVTTVEDADAVKYYLESAIDYMSHIVDVYNEQNNHIQPQGSSKPSGKPNTKAEKMLPIIRSDIQRIQEIVNNISQYTRGGGYIQKQIKDALDAFIRNDAMERYEEKLKGSSLDSDKQLAGTLSQLRSQISQILSGFPNVIGEGYRVNPNTPKMPDNIMVLSDTDRLQLGEILSKPDFANSCEIELVYGFYDSVNKRVVKQDRRSNAAGVGIYAIISYGEKTYNPVYILPSHYTDQFNTLTEEGEAFLNKVITLQAVGKVIASDVHRILPNVHYNQNTTTPVTLNPVLRLTEQDLQQMNPQSRNIGMCKTQGKIFPLDSTETTPLATLSSAVADRNVGGIFYMLPFNYEEYLEGSSVVPVRLLTPPLKDGDIDVILSILKDLKTQFDITGTLNLGKEYSNQNGATPFTNLQVLQFLSNFEQNERKCRIYINPDGTVKTRTSVSQPFGANIDPSTQSGQDALRTFFKQSAQYVFNHVKILSGKLSNTNDPLYKKLGGYIQANGSLNISPSLMFDEDDLTMNGEGFYGIGWAMRHGRIVTNAGYLYEPSVGISDVTTPGNAPVGPYNPQPTAIPQPQQSAPVDNGMDWLEQVIKNANGNDAVANSTIVGTDRKLNKEEAIKNIRRMIGENFPVYIEDGILEVLSSGAEVVGQCFIDSIVLSSQAVQGTEYHESFHRVVELMMPAKDREKLYKIYVNQHPQLKLAATNQIGEHMAESFRIWMTEYKPDSFKFTWNIIKLFRQVRDWVNAIKRIGSFRLAYAYYKINTGRYANIRPTEENIARYKIVFGRYAPMTVYNPQTNQDVDLKNFTSISDYNAGIETVARMIINEYLKADNTIEVTDIDLSADGIRNMSGYKYLVGNEKKTAANKAFIELFDNWDNIKSEVVDKLKALGLGIRQNKVTGKISIAKSSLDTPLDTEKEHRDDKPTNEGAVAEMMDYISKESYEISRTKKIKDFIKFLLSSIEDMHYVEEGETNDEGEQISQWIFETNDNGQYIDEEGTPIVYRNGRWECDKPNGTTLVGDQVKFKKQRNVVTAKNVFGFKKYLSFDEVYAKLLADCHRINTVSDLVSLLKEKSANDLMYKQVYDKVMSAYNNLLYVDKDGFHHDKNGGLWRMMTPTNIGQPVLVKVGDDRRPIFISEEDAKQRPIVIQSGGKFVLAMDVDQVDLQYNWNSVSLIVQLFNAVAGTKLNYKMVIASKDSQSSTTYRVSDTDSGYTAKKFSQSWYLSFISNRQKVESIEHNGVIYHRTKDPQLFNRVHEFFATVLNAFVNPKGPTSRTGNFVYNGRTYNVYTNTDTIKRMIVQNFNSIGISIDKKTFDHMLFTLFGDMGHYGLVRYFSQNADISGRSKGVNMEFFLKSMMNCQTNGVFKAPLESGAFFMASGVVGQLADAKYSYNTIHKQLSVSAPGGNRYYVMSEKNTITLMTELLSDKDSQTVQDFTNCPYYTYRDPITGVSKSTFILDAILSGDYKLVFDNFVGFKNEDIRGDQGSDYMQIQDAVDLISKITLLENNNMIFPIMSNKKTYGQISLVDKNGFKKRLPGIRFISNDNDSKHIPYSSDNIPTVVGNVYDNNPITNGNYSKYSMVFPDEVYDLLIRYAKMEYETVKYGIKTINEMGDEEKVDNLHLPNKKTKQSSAGICRFPRFYGVYKPEVVKDGQGNIVAVNRKFYNFNDNNKSDIENLRFAEQHFFGEGVTNTERKAMINELLMIQLEKWLDHVENAGIIRKRQGWRSIENPLLRYESDILDKNLINSIVASQQKKIDGGKTLSAKEAKSLAIVQLLMDVHIKHQISMEEIQRLYLGHPGEFDTEYDQKTGRITNDTKGLSKRAGGLASTGETNAIGVMGIPTEYVCSEMDDYYTVSPQAEEFKEAFKQSEHRSTLFNSTVKRIDTIISNFRITSNEEKDISLLYDLVDELSQILGDFTEGISYISEEMRSLILSKWDKPYSKNEEIARIRRQAKELICAELHNKQKDLTFEEVEKQLEEQGLLAGVQARVGSYASSYEKSINVGDGASYISPKMCKNMLIQLGLFKGKVVKAFNYLEKGISKDILSDAEACSVIMEAMLGSQKYTAYGYRMNRGFPEFYYNKTALFPMFRQLCVTPKLKGIYDMMTKGDEPIDMLMFKSSVKVGGKGSQVMPEFSSDFDNFKPNTYKQQFRFLIKQLNTDPKDREKMSMGTQALKVIESILNTYVTDYQRREADGTLSNTKIVDGKTLRDEIMFYRKAIAEKQLSAVIEKFYDASGAKNEKEFVTWIKSALTERDSSTDMLRALQLEEDGSRKTKLGGMSDGGWVQSIVTTLINKECIDLNLPGNMFIQRSVFGMEGRVVADKYVPSINGGERLKLVNEQGSMDAVISIDYFVEMFPKQLKGKSFKEQRDWLIEKGIIGKKAKALTVSYRIPTQAASSISALRFVDVLPIVRDTIVLPEEFTALTGSDFDIDKLFFSMKNLHLTEDGNVSEEYEPGTLEFYQNALLETFITLLQQDRNKVGNISLRSVDKDTQLGKSVAEELTSSVVPVDPYDALSLWKQSEIKEQNRTGGEAVGPAALNNSSQNIGRLFDLHLANTGVVRQLGISDLSSDLDIDSQSVLGILGAYINGAVDNAKDPWISIVGLNGYTYNLANTLARAGFGRSTLYFTAQPVVKALAKIQAYAESSLFRGKQQTVFEVEEELTEEFENEYFLGVQGGVSEEARKILKAMKSPMARHIEQYHFGNIGEQQEEQYNLINRSYAIIKAIVGVDHENPHKKLTGFTRSNGKFEEGSSIMRDVALMYSMQDSHKALTDHTKRYSIDIKYKDAFDNEISESLTLSPNEVEMYLYMLNQLLNYPAKAVSDSVQYTKIDTKKQGKNTAEQYAYLYGYEKLKASKAFDSSMMDMLYDSYIEKLTVGTIQLHQKLLSDEYIEAMDPMISFYENNWVSEFLTACGARVNADTVKAAVNGITSYVKYKYIQDYADQIRCQIKELFIGEHSIYNQLDEIKTTILENPVLYREYVDGDGNINNILLDALEPAWIREKDFEDIRHAPKFIEVVNKEEDNGNSINALRMAWEQMLNDDKHKDIQAFAKRLIVYGFITSGDTNIPGTLFKYVPFSWRYEGSKLDGMEKSYTEYISDFIEDGNVRHRMNEDAKKKSAIPIMVERRNGTIYDEILINNWNNPSLVPTVPENKDNKKYYKTLTLNKEMNTPDILIAAETTIEPNARGVIQHVIRKASVNGSPRIVKVHKEGHVGYNQEDFDFYRLYSMGTSVDKYGNVFTYPIYTLINPRGGVFYGNKILEYMSNQGFDWNNRGVFVDESKLAEIEKLISIWNDSIKTAERPANISEPDWERIMANTYLTLDQIGIDENSAITLLTASMALYDSFRRKDQKYKSSEYKTNVEKGGSKISYSDGEVSRKEMINNPRTLYIFTDNTNRTSGRSKVSRDSKYYKRYGDGVTDLFYPSKTRAVARGLDNTMPISTQRFYNPSKGLSGVTGRWTNADIEEFKNTIDAEFEAIEFEWASGNYDNIVILGGNDGLFNADISDIREEGDRSEIYKYLKQKLDGLFQVVDGISNTEKYYYPGKPTLNAVPNWQPGSIFYAGVGSEDTPQDVLDNMTALAAELEKEGYVLRSGGAPGADTAFSNGVSNAKNKKIYFKEDIEHNIYGTAEQADKILEETHPAAQKLKPGTWARQLLARDNYQVFGDQLDSPAAFVICWTNDGVTSYEQTTATTGGTGQAIRVASRKGIPVINMKDSNWREKLNEVLQKNKPQESLEVWYGSNGRGPNAMLSNMAERPFVLSDASADRLNEIFESKDQSTSVSNLIRTIMNGRRFHGVEHAFQMTKMAAMYIHVLNQDYQKKNKKGMFGKNQSEQTDVEETGFTQEQRQIILENIRYTLNKIADAPTNKEAKRLGGQHIGDVYGIIDQFFKGVWNNKDEKPDPTTGSYKAMGVLQINSFQQNEKAAEKLVATGNKRFTHEKGGDWATAFPQVLTVTRNYIRNHVASNNAPAIRTNLVIADSSSQADMDRAAAAVGGVITTRQQGEKFHFGNPFSHNPNWGIVTGDGTIADAVKAFDAWLAGTEHQDVEPERRQWILDMINSGMLDDTPLVYYTSNATDKTGTHAYSYDKFPNHAHILLKYINMHIANPMDSVERFASPMQAKATLESDKGILTNAELAEWNAQGVTNPKILVASERTDPAFFANELIDIIEGRRNAAGWGPTANKYTGKDFNALYIITKHDGAPIRKILQTKIPKLIHFSVTSLGGTVWEPKVMKYQQMLDKIQGLIKDGLDPNCVTIRIDPIVPGVTMMSDVEEIIKRSAAMGIKRIRFSVCDMYKGNTVRLSDGRTRIKPAAWVPALERTEQEYGKAAREQLWNTLVQAYGTVPGKPHLLNFNAYPERIYSICDRVAQLGEKYGITLSTCAEGINHPKVTKEGCLSVAQVNELLGTSIEDKGEANNDFRSHCSCFGGKIDAFDYSEDCSSICGYCYGGHANDDVMEQKIKETRDEQNVLEFNKELLKEMGAKVLKHCNKFI